MSKPADAATERPSQRAMGATPKQDPRIRPSSPIKQGALHLVVGPVGAGKSTHASRLADEQAAVVLTLDAWMTRLFRPDRPDHDVMPWYVERADRCVAQIWDTSLAILARGVNVVLEIGLIQRRQRDRFLARVDAAGLDLHIHVVQAAREVRRRRVEARNRHRGATYSMEVPKEVFELASDLYEPLDDDEVEGRRVHRIRTDR